MATKKKKVSFDFDKTLSEKEVQIFVKKLMTANPEEVDVHIVTYRYDDTAALKHPQYIKKWWSKSFIDGPNCDLKKVASELRIPKENIHYTNFIRKGVFFSENSDFLFHLDDSIFEISSIHDSGSSTIPILYPEKSWDTKILRLLGLPKVFSYGPWSKMPFGIWEGEYLENIDNEYFKNLELLAGSNSPEVLIYPEVFTYIYTYLI